MKLKTLFAAASLALLTACMGDATGSGTVQIGPPPALPAGADTVTTVSGLKYVDIVEGAGLTAQVGDLASYHYTLWLGDGTGVSTTKGGPPQGFTVGSSNLVAGFREGMVGMMVGGKRRLIIPPSLGYGATPQYDGNGNLVIPANSTLIFDLELVSITRGQ